MPFSIVITTYNAEKFLVEALDSLKNQTFQDFDCVITDDCSTDRTLEICKTWLSENPEFQHRTKIIESSVNTGVSANTNRGLKVASSEWIYVLSADDALLETALENVHNFVAKNPNVSILQGIAATYNDDFSEENFIEHISENRKTSNFFNLSTQQQHSFLLNRCNIVAPAVFYKKSIVEEVGFCDEKIPQIDDWPLWLKLTKQGHKIHFYNKTLVKYRLHARSITNENKGLFVTDLHRKERLIYRLHIAPNIGIFKKITYRLKYGFSEILYRFFNSKNNWVAVQTLCFLRVLKRFFSSKKAVKDSKHIAFFMQDFEMGGVGIVFWNYIKILKPLGYRIDVIVARERGALYERFAKEAHIINLGNIRQRYAIFKLRKQIKKSSISTLISGSELANFVAVLAIVGLKKSCKLIVTQHGLSDTHDDKDTGFKSRFINLFKRLLYRHASHIVAVSNAVAEDLKKHKLPENRIKVLYNPIFRREIETLANTPATARIPEKYVLFVGRLVNVKNMDLLFDAFVQIVDNDLHLVVLGDGYNRQRLEEKAQALSSRIHFCGIVDNPMPFIKHAKIVAIPSFSEAMPMVAIEAAVLGKTVVHTPNQGCLEIFGADGSYCSKTFDDPKDFAEQLLTALEKPIDAAVLDEKTKRFEESNSWSLLEKILKKA